MELILNVKMLPTIFSDHSIIELKIYSLKLIKVVNSTESIQILSSLNFYKGN